MSCATCGTHLFLYQKDGPGIVKRLYVDRIYQSNVYEGLQHRALQHLPQLLCPHCGEHLGVPIVYQKEQRLAFRLFAGAVTTKISKRPRGDEQEADDVSYCNDSTHSCPIATLNSTKSVRGGVMVLPSLPPMMAFLGSKRSSLCTILL